MTIGRMMIGISSEGELLQPICNFCVKTCVTKTIGGDGNFVKGKQFNPFDLSGNLAWKLFLKERKYEFYL